MSKTDGMTKILGTALRIGALGLLIYAVIASGRFTDLIKGPGFGFVLLAGTALSLTGFSASEIVSAFKHAGGAPGRIADLEISRYFWEAAARNMYMFGILGTSISFIIGLGSSEGGLGGISLRMISALLSTLYGMILGVVCYVPAMKLSGRLDTAGGNAKSTESASAFRPPDSRLRFENVLGYVLVLVILAWTMASSLPSISTDSPLQPVEIFLHWPSLLIVLGGTIVLLLFMGREAIGRSLTLSFAFTGLIGSIAGMIQTMLAFAGRSIEEVAASMVFLLSCCFLGLTGMMLLGAPLEDRALKYRSGPPRVVSTRIAWLLFPLLMLLFLLVTFVLVITPMKKVA